MTPKKHTTFELHPAQVKIYLAGSEKRELVASAGEQGGKTILGAVWLRRQMRRWGGQSVNFVVGAPTYKVMEQSTRPTFMKLVSEYIGKWDGQDDVFRLRNGGSIYFRSATDPDSVVGIPDVGAAWIDEGGKCSRMFYINVRGRAARLGGPTLVTTTPYALNWVKKDLIDPYERNERTDIEYSRWRSIDNPAYPKEEYERLKRILPTRIFRMRVEGFHDKAEGLVFDDWGEGNWCDPIPYGEAKVYGGIDWGFDHPFAVTVRAVFEDGLCYGVSIFKKSGLSVSQQIDLIQAKTGMFHVKQWFCGHDRPEMILELQNRGINAAKYFEYAPEYREVNAGNAKHAELIRMNQYKVFRGIDQWQDLQDEYETYVWDKDDADENRTRERPISENDDLMAAERYCTVGMVHLVTKKPKAAEKPLLVPQKVDRFKFGRPAKDWDAY